MPVDKRIFEIIDYLHKSEKDNFLANYIIDHIHVKFDKIADLSDHISSFLECPEESEKDKELMSLLDEIEAIRAEYSKPADSNGKHRELLIKHLASAKPDENSRVFFPALPTDSLELVMDLICKYSEVKGSPSLKRNKLRLEDIKASGEIFEDQSSEHYANLLGALLNIGEKISTEKQGRLEFVVSKMEGGRMLAAIASLHQVISKVDHAICNQKNASDIAKVANSVKDLGVNLDSLLNPKQIKL